MKNEIIPNTKNEISPINQPNCNYNFNLDTTGFDEVECTIQPGTEYNLGCRSFLLSIKKGPKQCFHAVKHKK